MNVINTVTQFLGKGSEQFTVHLDREDLTQVYNFVYLGGVISTNDSSETDVKRRIDVARWEYQLVWIGWRPGESYTI